MHAYTHLYIHIVIYTHTHIYAHTHIYIYTYIYNSVTLNCVATVVTNTNLREGLRQIHYINNTEHKQFIIGDSIAIVLVYTYIHTHIYIYTYTHIYICTYIYI